MNSYYYNLQNAHKKRKIMDLQQSTFNQTDVSFSLARHLMSTEAKEKNLVFSPLSIQVALGVIASGSGGSTRDQILKFLKSYSIEEVNFMSSQIVDLIFTDGAEFGGPRLSFANGVWVDRSLSLKPSFRDVVEKDYKAALDRVDFRTQHAEVTKEINTWADTKTNGLIKEILLSDAIDASTRLVFANTLYFKGEWNQKFDPSKTKPHPFFLLNGTSVQAPFLTTKKMQWIHACGNFKVLGLPYKRGGDNRQFTMYIFLPDAKDGLSSLVERIGSESNFLGCHLPYQQVEVGDFRVPKFKISFGFEAKDILKGLGLVLPFEGEALTEMVDSENLYVSQIIHKSFIEVNEEGTEAAAVTILGPPTGLAPHWYAPPKMDFVADHPFLFVIMEDLTGVVMFIGHVLNPMIE